MTHIVVTGAAGFIGSHTVDCLLAAGHSVTGVDNFRTGRRENLAAALSHPQFELREADVSVPGILASIAAERPTAGLIHLVALVSVPESVANPPLNQRLNVEATYLAAEAARLSRIPRVVFASSAAVYGNTQEIPIREESRTAPISPYGAAKLASEALLIGHATAFGFVARCQRYFNVYGPRQDPASPYSGVISVFARRFREGLPITLYGDGRQTRDFISVHDVARANVLAVTGSSRSGSANICTGKSTSLLEIVELFQRRYPAAPRPSHAPSRDGDIRHSCGAALLAANELGFRAAISFEDGLAELIRLGA